MRTGLRHDLQASLSTIAALMLREMSSRYGRSPGGYIWALLVPMGGIAIMALGFSLVLRTPPLGNSFLLFYATGMLPFNQFMELDTTISRALRYSKALLAYPAVRWIDALLARFLLNLLTKLVVTGIVLGSIMAFTETRTFVDVGAIVTALAMAAALGFGMGVMNCALDGLFPAWDMIWSIITRPIFLASGILLLYRDMPSHVQEILWWNPLLHVVGAMRAGFYPMYDSSYVSPAYAFGVALALLAMGLLLVRRHHLNILNE
ncbi:ABC transporter permease [Gemmobacter sp.]|uniref:ABC transporter permease n=1 Tax=Gemmobacter sp. TaxID=1898957 RepID=UPI0025C34001|nr:ABC transporter permease [Gemmobacter sp.]